MNKMKVIISFCFVCILLLFTYIFIKPYKTTYTFKNYTMPANSINKELIMSIDKNNNNNDSDIEKEVIESVLNIIKYDKWKDFLDYIHMELYYCNLTPSQSDQLIISLNLSKDLGVVVIFEEYKGSYVFHSKIENLDPIDEIKLIKHPTKNKDLIAIYQIKDERLGAFFYESFVQIYDYTGTNYDIVWEKTIFYEEMYKNNWINIDASGDNWTMVIEETEIDFDYTDSIRVNTITSLEKYEAQSKITPLKSDFKLIEEKSFIRSYNWNEDYGAFILGELSKDVFISNVGILEDMDTKHEWLFGIRNPYYKVATPNKEVIYLPKSKFSKLIENGFY